MMKRLMILGLIAAACTGITCRIDIPDDPDEIPLYRAAARMVIYGQVDGLQVEVTADVTDGDDDPIVLTPGQAITVNGEELAGPNDDDQYTKLLSAAAEYVIRVHEPTRGVEETTVAAVPDFDITAPAQGGTVSLSGFTITWSNADSNLKVRILLSQTIFDEDRQVEFGPFTDTGTRSLTSANLAQFQQGANLNIQVTKIREVADINGFDAGSVSVELAADVDVAPGP